VKIGKETVDLKSFATVKEARDFKGSEAGYAELEAALEKFKDILNERRETNTPRIGENHRNGADVTPAQFSDTFGFRGVQFGNYVEGARRQADLNEAYDALMDMAGVLGIPAKAISLNGELGLAFGARGQGGKKPAKAHYEPDNIVINLTKNAGAGSLAHEWWHALDNYFARSGGTSGFMTAGVKADVRPEMVEAFANIIRTIRNTALVERSRNLDKRRTKEYWSTPHEMTARAFESYMIARLGESEFSNDYLANIVSEAAWPVEDGYPYLRAAEIPAVRAAYDDLFGEMKVDTSGGGAKLYSLADPVEPEFPAAPKIDTPAFRKWFGDSKVVDEAGKPLVVYHGTSKTEGGAAFTMFDTYASNYGLMGMGGYFTESAEIAGQYAYKGRGDSPSVYPVYLSIKNAIDMEAKADPEAWEKQFPGAEDYHEGGDTNEDWYRAAEESIADQEVPKYEGAEIMQDGIRAMGFDGITHIGGGRVNPDGPRHRVWIAFDPEQIKSAISNTGDFDQSDPRIMHSFERENEADRRVEGFARRAGLLARGEAAATPDYAARLREWKPKLEATLKRLGIDDRILLNVVDRMGEANAHGSYWRRVITVALTSPDAVHTINHEAVHALRALGVIQPDEWTALVKAARANEPLWASIQKRYAGRNLNTLQMEEEAVADLFGEWSTKRDAKGFVGKAFQRISDLLKAIVAMLDRAATGNIQPGQVFRNIESGKIGGRTTGSGASLRGASKPSLEDAAYSIGDEPRRPRGLSRYAFRDPDIEVAFLTEHEFGPPKPKKMRADQYDLFARKIMLDEITATGDWDNLPYGFHQVSALAAKAKIDKAVNDNHEVSDAVRRYYQARSLAEAAEGVDPETILRQREEDKEAFKAANIRLDKIDGTAEIRNALKAAAESMEGFDEARRGVVTHEETQKLANEMDMPVDQLLARRKGQAFNAHELFAARAMLVASADNLVELAEKADGGSDADLIAFRRAWVRHVAIQEQVSGLTAEAGRALNQFKLLAKGGADLNARMMKELIETHGGREDAEGVARAILGLSGDPARMNRFARNAMKPTWRDKLYELWINGLLSGPATHVVNAVSNTLTAVGQLPEYALASGIGKARSLSKPDTDRILRSEVGARAAAMISGTKEAARLAAEALRTGEGSDVMSKIEARTQRAISGKKGEIVRIPSRLLIASDEFYKGVARRMELAAQAAKMATKEGLTGDAYKARVAELVAEPTDDMIEQAMDFARYSTFQRPLGEKGRAISNLVNKIPGMRLIVPFMRTPANIFKFAIERTPAAPILKEVRDDLAAGGPRRDLAMARIMLGTGVMITAMAMAAAGALTGGDPDDDDARRLLRAKGWQPYSVKIGDTYYSYQRLDPIATVLGLSADLLGQHEDMSDAEREKAFGNIFKAVLGQLKNKTFLSGIGDLLNAIDDTDRFGPQFIGRLAGTIVPTGVAQVANALDPTVRDVRSVPERIQSRIPGLSDNLMPKRDIFGRVITREGGVGPDVMSPFWTARDQRDSVVAELLRAGVNVNVPSRRVGGVELTAEQYDEYQALAGRFLRNGSERLVASRKWEAADAERKGEIFDRLKNGARKAARAALASRSVDWSGRRRRTAVVRVVSEIRFGRFSGGNCVCLIHEQTQIQGLSLIPYLRSPLARLFVEINA
jgi:hypothetical protein